MSKICPFPQHRTVVANAMAVVLAPDLATPQQRLLAWAALKAARGQNIRQLRLARLMDAQGAQLPRLVLEQRDRIGGAA